MREVSVVATGMVTAVGFNAPATLAAVRAGISGIEEVNLWDADAGEQLKGARVRLPHWWTGMGKLVELASPAIDECLRAAAPFPRERIPILLCVSPVGRLGRPLGTDDHLLEEIEIRLGVERHPSSGVVPLGQAAVGPALLAAERLLRTEVAPYCVVAGVDTYLDQRTADVYMRSRRLMSPGNSNGFFPGEAAAAILIVRANTVAGPQLRILGIGRGSEAATIESEEPLRGSGLVDAVHDSLQDAGLTFGGIDYRITDLNGEHYKFKEAMFVIARLMRQRKEKLEVWHPVECVGEIGAAIGPCALAVALDAGLHGYAPGPTVLCHFGSDGTERVAAVARFG